MPTPAQNAKYQRLKARRAEQGMKPVTIWLPPAAYNRLALLAKSYGSMDKAVEAFLSDV